MTTDEIRRAFLDFFKAKGHEIVESDSLVPRGDPTLLFTGAGMNQFKEQFLGKNITFRRAASSQKCLRTGDLDNVGKTSGHHTFFEMLGNFSFGNYFKEEAILWAWEFMAKRLKLPEEKLWASVYKDDDEACRIWIDKVALPEDKIVKLGAKENFWPSNAPTEGPNGPCGPCSEIFYDYGRDTGCGKSSCDPSCDCGRFVEVWNMVFTQFDRQSDGSLNPLPNKNIDTGMGLERLAAVMQGVKTNFEIDIFQPIIGEIKKHAKGGKDTDVRSKANAISDHIRAVAFAICDGVMPSNEERGYVVRKLIRRSVLYSRSLGVTRPYLYKVIAVVANVMQGPYPELKSRRESISQVVRKEEENFLQVLENQGPRVEEAFEELAGKKGGAGVEKELAEIAFNFYDTFGIPYEVLEEYAEEKCLKIPKEAFEKLLDSQRELSRRKSKIKDEIFSEDEFESAVKALGVKTEFLGYEEDGLQAKVIAILGPNGRIGEAEAGKGIRVVVDRTTFYGESGGQVGDKGIIKGKDLEVGVDDTKRIGNTIIHIGRVIKGVLREGDMVDVKIDKELRDKTRANHTATHLLQNALRKVLGEHVRQTGSLVDVAHLRFDFTHMKKLESRELDRVEDLVNANIAQAHKVDVRHMAFDEASKLGAIALFGEKYADVVRVVSVGDSKELCGGTHVDDISQIDLFMVTSESGVASGVRRIEALTGEAARSYMKDTIDKLVRKYSKKKERLREAGSNINKELEAVEKSISNVLRGRSSKIQDLATFRKAKEIMEKAIEAVEDLSKKVMKERKKSSLAQKTRYLNDVIQKAIKIDGVSIISALFEDSDINILRSLVDKATSKVESSVVVLGSSKDRRAYLVCALTEDVVKRGASAASIIREVAKIVGGSGGGRPDFAQAGGDSANLDRALKNVHEIAKKELSK